MADGALLASAGATTVTSPSFCNSVRSAPQPGGVDAVVIGQQDSHALLLQQMSPDDTMKPIDSSVLIWFICGILPFSPQDVVIVLGEAVGLVADVLQQPQRRRVPAQTHGSASPGR